MVGQDIKASCTASGSGQLRIEWIKDDIGGERCKRIEWEWKENCLRCLRGIECVKYIHTYVANVLE